MARSKLALASALVALCLAAYAGSVLATTGTGFVGTTIAKGTFGNVFSLVHDKTPKPWSELILTHGSSDLYVQQNTWQPGGSTGWHTHPGPSFVIVTQGSVTVYEGDDKTCTPHVYTANTANNSFVDAGGGDVHLIRNETGAVAQSVAVQLIPAGATRREDAANPGHCSF
jgi:predicted metal-dependent enzyme (double-stranded beta helix superfamily)